VKQLEFVDEKTTSIIKNLKLNFKNAGKKYGKRMKVFRSMQLIIHRHHCFNWKRKEAMKQRLAMRM